MPFKIKTPSPETERIFWRNLARDIAEEIFERKAEEIKKEISKALEEIRRISLKGDQGYTPQKGRDYFDGQTPVKGVDYFTKAEILQFQKAVTPVKGKDYFDGQDAEAPSPEAVAEVLAKKIPKPKELLPKEIAQKLNTLDEAVDASVVKGLKKMIANIKKIARTRAGGGMGNVQHESFNVGISTTTVTTAFKIAGNGYAIWAYYNGQFIARGTHYTVGSDLQTLTLTFTSQNSTVIDLIYIRG